MHQIISSVKQILLSVTIGFDGKLGVWTLLQ